MQQTIENRKKNTAVVLCPYGTVIYPVLYP